MKKILIVEDDMRLAAHWQSLLESCEYQVIHETSLNNAISVLESTHLDLVITDLVLESRSEDFSIAGGLSVVSYIAMKIRPRPRIITVSAHVSESTYLDRNFQKVGNVKSLRKPISDKKLISTVKELMEVEDVADANHRALESQLSKFQHSYRAMVDLLGATDGVWDWRVGSDDAIFTPGFRKLLGFGAEDIASIPNSIESFSQRIHPDDVERVWATVNQSFANKKPLLCEFRIQHKNGHYIWVRNRAMGSFDESGQAVRMVGSMHDVSIVKASQKKLRLNQKAIDTAADAIVWVNADGQIIYANRTMAQRLQYSEAELTRMDVAEINPELESVEEFKTRFWPNIVENKSAVFELTHQRKDGTTFPVEIATHLIEHEDEQFACSIVRDLTEKRAAEQELARGQFFLENSQDATYWVTEDSSFVYVNKAATSMLGHTRQQLLKMRVVDIDPNYPPDVWKQWWEKMRQDRHAIVETEHVRDDGSKRFVEVTVHFIEHAGKEYIVGVTRDISERIEAQRNLARSDFFFKYSQEATYWVTEDASVVYANKAACDLLGYSNDELLQMRVFDFDPDATPEFWEAHWKEMKARKSMIIERKHQRDNGDEFWTEMRIHFLNYAGVDYLVGISRDITDRRAAEAEFLRAKHAVEKSEERLNLAMTNANIGLWDWNLESDEIKFNDTYKTQLGYPADAPWEDFSEWESRIHQDDRDAAFEAAKRLVDFPNEPYESTFRMRTATGEYRWIRAIGQGVFDNKGNANRRIGVHLDITDTLLLQTKLQQSADENERAKQLAQESEERFRLIADCSTPLMWTTEADGTCQWLNQRWLDYSGRTLEQEIGYGWTETVHPEDRDQSAATYHAAMDAHEPFVLEYRLRRYDGEYRWFRVDAEVRRDAAGEFLGYVGMSSDIHDAKRAEADRQRYQDRLQENADRFNWAMTNANIGVWEWVPETNEVYFSDALKAQLGFAPQEQWDTFHDWQRLLHPHDKEPALQRAAELFENPHAPYESTFRLRTSTGEYRWIRSIGRGVFDAKDKLDRFIGVHLDVQESEEFTQLEIANQKLADTNEELERFAYVASHDLQEPLRAIGGFLQLLLEKHDLELDEQSRGYIDRAVAGAGRMSELINDLLYFSRVTREQADFDEGIDLAKVIQRAKDDLRTQVEDTGTEIVVADLPVVRGAHELLVQLFRNLIGNAIKYRSKANPKIEIGFDSGKNCIFVQDNGIGIDAKYQTQIFDLFKRLHRREEYPGTGLGLAICKRIAERHGWAIYVDSKPGIGSCFYLQLSDNVPT